MNVETVGASGPLASNFVFRSPSTTPNIEVRPECLWAFGDDLSDEHELPHRMRRAFVAGDAGPRGQLCTEDGRWRG